MANLLVDAANWEDYVSAPPASWTGTQYVIAPNPGVENTIEYYYLGTVNPDDTVSGTMSQVNDDGTTVYLLLISEATGGVRTIIGSVPLPNGVETPFNFSTSAHTALNLVLLISFMADSPNAVSPYGFGATITPGDPPDPPTDCCDDPEPQVPGFAPIPDPVDPNPPEEPDEPGDLPNCDCYDDTSGRRTLRQLRDAVMDVLGFVDVLGRGPQKTLCQMRCSVLGALNLGSNDEIATRTLAQIRAEVTKMSGFSANVPTPPGFNAMVDAFVNEAQQLLWRRLEMSRIGEDTPPAWLVADGDPTEMDGALVQTMALALVKAHYQKPDANAYREYVETVVKGYADRQTPVSDRQVDNALRRARYTAWNRAVALPAMVEDDDLSTIHFLPIELLAIAELKARLGHKDADLYRRDYEKYTTDAERRSPPDAQGVVTRLLQSAQDVLYRRYVALRTERFYSWPLTVGVRMYDLPDNAEECNKRLDPRKITWVGVEKDGEWYPLRCGIPPELYTLNQTSFPQRYEIRQCIEVWPTPDETDGRLVVKGHFKPEPFVEEYHRTTIDDELVYLHALANAKAHYKQPDARNYADQMEVMLTDIVAGSHHTRRYLPGARVRTVEPDPTWTSGAWP